MSTPQRKRASWVLLSLTVLLAAVLGFLLTQARTRTELEKARADLLEKRSHAVLDSAPVAIIVCDAERRVTYANQHAEELFGYTEESLIGERVTQLIAYENELQKHRTEFDAAIGRLKQHSGPWEITKTVEGTAKTKAGELIPVLIRVRGVKYDGQIEFIAAVTRKTPKPSVESRPLPHVAMDSWNDYRQQVLAQQEPTVKQ